MFSNELTSLTADEPLYLSWVRQGKVWWSQAWVDTYGPVRERIPGLDDHIGFANYDLRLNSLSEVHQTADGRPFVSCLRPRDSRELWTVQQAAIAEFRHPWQVDEFMKTHVIQRLAKVASILDVVHYHGFEPAARTSGLDYLDQVLPRRPLRRVE